MDVKLTTLPDEVVEALGPDVEREALEGILLLLVGEGKLPLQRAGEVLGLDDREEAARWYAERASFRLDPEGEIGEIVHLEHLTPEDLDRLDRFLDIPPAENGSGISDVSINHDKYLYGDTSSPEGRGSRGHGPAVRAQGPRRRFARQGSGGPRKPQGATVRGGCPVLDVDRGPCPGAA